MKQAFKELQDFCKYAKCRFEFNEEGTVMEYTGDAIWTPIDIEFLVQRIRKDRPLRCLRDIMKAIEGGSFINSEWPKLNEAVKRAKQCLAEQCSTGKE